jgi:hypothetical protein
MKYIKLKKTKPWQKAISFHAGGLHESLGVKSGDKIPDNLMQAALAGKEGKLAKKQSQFKKNVLTGPKK